MRKITLEEINKRLLNKNITLIGDYKNNRTPTKFRCEDCNLEWLTQPDHIFCGSGCPRCSGRLKLTNQIIDDRISKDIRRLGNFEVNFSGNKNKIEFVCNKCDYRWFGYPNDYINKNCGCPKCKMVAKLSNEEIEKRLPKNIVRVGDYKNSISKIEFLCKDCETIFQATPAGIYQGKWGCPVCKLNKWERLINDTLLENNIRFKPNYFLKIDGNRYYIDFYLLDYNIAIEYNGRQHYYPIKFYGGKDEFKKQVARDNLINEYCKNNKINLIVFKYSIGYKGLKDKLKELLTSIMEMSSSPTAL